jgi:uncharacterized protein (TIGR03437 family)
MRIAAFLLLLIPAALQCQTTSTPVVRFHTNLGDIDVTLLPNSAPLTVANFMNYMNRGAYNNSIFHRSVAKFVIQGGGYQLVNSILVPITADPAVKGEPGLSNSRGTLAMALSSDANGNTDQNSGTDQWFFNEIDNASALNAQGFTVFGRVTNAASLAVMDKIAAVNIFTGVFASPYDSIPLINYRAGDPLLDANYVLVISVSLLVSPPAIAANGIVSASGFGGYTSAAPGSYIEIKGSNLAGTTRTWGGGDFTNGNAPTSLDGVSVSVNGQAAYVYYVSPGQINAQIPVNVPSGGNVPVIVTYNNQSSPSVMFAIKPLAGGLLAPPTFLVNGKQYVAAFHSDGTTFVSSGNIPGTTAAPAVPGETLIFYGLGFGGVSPSTASIAGQIAAGQSTITNSVQFKFGASTGQVLYSGLAPGYVGLYQFNVTVPADSPTGDVPLTVVLGADTLAQTLFIPVQAKP